MFTEIAKKKLQEAWHKLTPSRIKIIEHFQVNEKPLSPYDIQKSNTTLDVVSVYRTLELLESLWLIHKIRSLGGYTKCTISHCWAHHDCCHEFQICTTCGSCNEVHTHHTHHDSQNWFIPQSHLSEHKGICQTCAW